VRVVPTATTRILRRSFPGTCKMVGQLCFDGPTDPQVPCIFWFLRFQGNLDKPLRTFATQISFSVNQCSNGSEALKGSNMTIPRSISPSHSWSTMSLDMELTTLQQNTANYSVQPARLLRYELDELIILKMKRSTNLMQQL